MTYLPNAIFLIMLSFGVGYFVRNIAKIRANIRLGKAVDRSDQPQRRWGQMIRVALGQSKMVVRPVAGIMHIIVYVGFILINIELLEIILDGILGTHRVFAPYLGSFYNLVIATFEILAALVLLAVVVFWMRRNVLRLQRFMKPEMQGWPKKDADLILYFEVVLMFLFLSMNATDLLLQQADHPHYLQAGSFPVSTYLTPLYDSFSTATLVALERSFWWLHIGGILIFLNYLYYSKHLHILLAFPNTYYANLEAAGKFKNNAAVSAEVKLMMDPDADPYAAPADEATEPDTFGAADVRDLSWVQLLNAYTCTECGRCTSECPANQTGKMLSPRKIMMDTRDRIEEVGRNYSLNKGTFVDDGKQLLDNYISREELWACTSCNACVQACPIGIDPLSIIMDMRQYLVMEQSAAPAELNNMMSNIENNGAPWPFSNQDRLLWANKEV